MVDVEQKTIELRQTGVIKGSRPVLIKIMKGNYPYKGKYALLFNEHPVKLKTIIIINKVIIFFTISPLTNR